MKTISEDQRKLVFLQKTRSHYYDAKNQRKEINVQNRLSVNKLHLNLDVGMQAVLNGARPGRGFDFLPP